MLDTFFKYYPILIFRVLMLGIFPICAHAQTQDFEKEFSILSYPQEFLQDWYGNEVRNTSSRIFQVSNQGRNASKGLAVQPISTFDGVIWVRLNVEGNANKKVVFWAKSLQNGTGTRPALVYYSWARTLEGEFMGRAQLGNNDEFPNGNRDYRKYTLVPPENFHQEDEIFLRLEVKYGPGTGSAARWVMDDFGFGEFEADTQAPRIGLVKGYSPRELLVQFDEKTDPVFSLLPPAYELGEKNPELILGKNDSTFILKFEEDLKEGVNYSLRIRQIPDLEGNFLKDTTVQFTFFDPIFFEYKSLVINELMPAPKADQDLPNVEYLELYNPTEKEFRLESLELSNSRSSTVLSDYWIQPGAYLILVPKGQENGFKDFGDVLGLSAWPTLLNSGDQISLKSKSGLEIDQVAFNTSSWGGSDFSGGGYSLEVPNPLFGCDNSGFLQVSKDPRRGSPGAQNSVFDPNYQFPELKTETAYFLDEQSFEIIFSSPMGKLLGIDQIQIVPNLKIDSLSRPSSISLRVFLAQKAPVNQVFQLSIKDVRGCRGEVINLLGPVELVLPMRPKKGDIILNEVLINPVSGDPKFVEIHNRTGNYLNLEGWSLANLDNKGIPSQKRFLGGKSLVIEPNGYLAITPDPEKLKSRYPKSRNGKFLLIPSLPSYPISGGTVVLLSSEGEVVESFTYSEDLHHPLVRDPKGVSLERIFAGKPVSDHSNWQSCSGIEDFATPGRENSQTLEENPMDQILRIDPQVFDPEGSSGPSFTSIQYNFDQPGWVGTLRVFSSAGQLVTTLCQNQILGTQGQFLWNGVDGGGLRVRPGYYVLLAEIFNLNGEVQVIKKTIVVASRL
jgi:hypothetical protein